MIQCQLHDCDVTRILLQLETDSVVMLCEECMEEKGLVNQIDKLVSFQRVKKQPEELLSKINVDYVVKSFFSKILKATEDNLKLEKRKWNENFKKLQEIIDALAKESESYFDSLIKDLDDFRKKLIDLVKFAKFNALISKDSQILGQQNTSREQQIFNCIKELEAEMAGQKKTDIVNLIQSYKDRIQNTSLPIVQEKLNFFMKMLNDYQSVVKDQLAKCNPELNQSTFQTKILSPKIQDKLIEKITNSKKYTSSLIYKAQDDVFNLESFWNSVNNRSNLLMIFKSKNKAVFGGYSPCLWKKPTNQMQTLVNDETFTSFLFSSNGDDIRIFPIKRENKPAIILSPQNGPNFGNELVIKGDFQGGSLNLGITYQYDMSLGQQNLVIFGGQNNPNISEFEIIQIVNQ